MVKKIWLNSIAWEFVVGRSRKFGLIITEILADSLLPTQSSRSSTVYNFDGYSLKSGILYDVLYMLKNKKILMFYYSIDNYSLYF